MVNEKKVGLYIIRGLIETLKEVSAVAEAIAKEKGLLLTAEDVHDPKLKEACVRLGKILALATIPGREEWMEEVNRRIGGTYAGWLRFSVEYVAEAEEYINFRAWTVPKLRDESAKIAGCLEKFEPAVRREADEAFLKALSLFD